ncbi:MAG: transposase [Acidobacteria bacterium]|nr:transposase [Acidobacteriota bacterium]
MVNTDRPKGWHDRGYLPHYDGGAIAQFITWRLHDSLPQPILLRLKEELKINGIENISRVTLILVEEYLDKGIGACYLRRLEIAAMVRQAFLFHAKRKFDLFAWVIIPNHVHILLRPFPGIPLHKIIHSLKSFTAHEANKILGRTGDFWMRDYFDRYIRDEEHFQKALRYIERNPVKAGLCKEPADWEFSSAAERKRLDRQGPAGE